MSLLDKLFHKFFGVPYSLHIYRQSFVKSPKATLVFLHGIGGSAKIWDEVLTKVRDDVNVVALDLLGFGYSPQPDWAKYDAATQARSVAKTLFGLGLRQKIILVGHSMGGLVAVEFARRYGFAVRSVIMCSPPIYNVDPTDDNKLFAAQDEQLRRLYEFAIKNPNNIVRVSQLAKKYKLLNPEFDVDHMNVDSYILALRANILNQTTVKDIVRVRKPIHIIYGVFDLFVIGDNLQKAAKSSSFITVEKYMGGHEIVGRYVKKVLKAIDAQLGIKG